MKQVVREGIQECLICLKKSKELDSRVAIPDTTRNKTRDRHKNKQVRVVFKWVVNTFNNCLLLPLDDMNKTKSFNYDDLLLNNSLDQSRGK